METTIRKPRRKWTYTTREAAEIAAREIGLQRDNSSLAVNALVDGTVIWLNKEGGQSYSFPHKFGTDNSYYTFGCIPRYCGAVLLVTHHCPQTGQKPYTSAYGEEWLQDEIDRQSRFLPVDDEARLYREGLYMLRCLVNDTRAD